MGATRGGKITLLNASNDLAPDPDRKGLISTSALAHYLAQHVPWLTGGAQTPGMEVRYDSTVFAAGLSKKRFPVMGIGFGHTKPQLSPATSRPSGDRDTERCSGASAGERPLLDPATHH